MITQRPTHVVALTVCHARGLRWLAALLLALCAIAVGCAGGGRLELVSLDVRSVDPPPPKASELTLDRCYWWTDDVGQVWVAMECVRHPFLGALGPFRFQMSLALASPPAGRRGRNYSVGERELRAVARIGPMESRFVSNAGAVAVYREPGDRLRGSFRLRVSREATRLLGGWSDPAGYLMQGTFDAVHDPQRGEVIAAATESQGWEREAQTPAGVNMTPPPVPANPQ